MAGSPFSGMGVFWQAALTIAQRARGAMQAVAMKVGLIAQQPLAVESLRQNIRSVLTDSQLRCNARKLQAEIKALPPVSEAVHRLMVLARESA